MTKKVKAWLKSGGHEAQVLWKSLGAVNGDICNALTMMCEAADKYEGTYIKALSTVRNYNAAHWTTLIQNASEEEFKLEKMWLELRDLFLESRRLLKNIGIKADVEIEPDEQTSLADQTMDIAGVLCAGVPGAGGVDAIYAITLGPEARKTVELFWSKWKDRTVCPLVLSADGVGDVSGVRVERDMEF